MGYIRSWTNTIREVPRRKAGKEVLTLITWMEISEEILSSVRNKNETLRNTGKVQEDRCKS